MKILTRIAAGIAIITTVGACEHGDPVSNAGGPLGQSSLFSGNPSASTLPKGSAAVATAFGGFTASVPDAFSRRNGAAGSATARRTQWYDNAAGGIRNSWTWRPVENDRNGGSLRDPRRPLLQSTTASFTPYSSVYSGANLITPRDEGADYFELWVYEIGGLEPNAEYTLAFVRYSLQINGQLDQEEYILTGAVTQPDSLYIASGRRDSIPNESNWSGDSPEGCFNYPGPHANPFIISTREPADGDGAYYPDKCWLPNGFLYGQSDHDTPAKSPVGRSDDVGYGAPSYNYLELWRGDFGSGQPVMRVQIAQDIDRSGKTINNTYPPFPFPTGRTGNPRLMLVDEQPSFPIGDAIKAQLNGAIGLPTGVTLTLENLQELRDGSVYKVWYINPSNGAAAPATGLYRRVVGTDTVDQAADVSSFNGGEGKIIFRDTDYNAPTSDSLRFVVVSIEPSAGAATPGGSQPLWVGIFKIPPGSAGGTMFFGDFNSGTNSVRYNPQGIAEGGVIGGPQRSGDSLFFQGSVVNMTFRQLTRPPEGYVYRAYLVKEADGELTPLGGLQGPDGRSLDDADTAPASANLTGSAIVFGKVAYDVRSIAGDDLCSYASFKLFLEPKPGVVPPAPPAQIFSINLPARVTDAQRCI